MQFLVDVLEMNTDRFDADRKFGGYFFVSEAPCHKLHNFCLTLGKIEGLARLAARGTVKGFHDEAGDLR